MSLTTPLHPLAISVFQDLLEYECLSRTQIQERCLSNLSDRRVQQLLQQWVEQHYLYVAQLCVWREPTGPRQKRTPQRLPRLYFAREAAADAVALTTGDHPRILRSNPKPQTLAHRYQTALTRVLYDTATVQASLPAARWLIESDSRAALPPNTPPNQRSMLYHSFAVPDRTISVRPDAASWHEIPQPNGELLSILGLWEIDLSSEGSKQLQRTKPEGFQQLLSREDYQRYWQQLPECVRIFWVVPSQRRIDTILNVLSPYKDVREASRFLQIADRDTKNLLTDPVWYHPVLDERVPIVDASLFLR